MTRKTASSVLSEIRFSDLELLEPVKRGVAHAGFTHCTPIQALTLPPALEGRDIAGQAQTGTGKTAAFLLVLFQRLLAETGGFEPGQPRALVLAPTRELALQIHKDALLLGAETGLKLGLAYGGIDYDKQRSALQSGVDILIGTPGRIIDYYKQNVFHLKQIRVMVLDEADRMFDLGFIKDIRYVLRRLPPLAKRQCLMFSATLSHRVLELAYEHMNDPELLKIDSGQVTVENVRQTVYYTANSEKMPLLTGLLRAVPDGRVMIFTNTRAATERVERTLNANGFHAAAISGRVPQQKRQTLLRRFHEGEIPILVATDVAARGLHIPDVTHVINYDLPQDAPDYVHRIGRTARLGATGEAISFACENYAFHLPEIEEYIGRPLPMRPVEKSMLQEVRNPPPKPRSEEDAVDRRSSRPRRPGRPGSSGSHPGRAGHSDRAPSSSGRQGRGRRRGSRD